MSCKSCHNHNNCFEERRPGLGCRAEGCRCGIPKANYCCDGGFHNGYGNYGYGGGRENYGRENYGRENYGRENYGRENFGWDNNYRADRSIYGNAYGRQYGASNYFNHPRNPVYGGYFNYNGIPNISTRSDYFTTF